MAHSEREPRHAGQSSSIHEKWGPWWLGLIMGITTVAIASIHQQPDTGAAPDVAVEQLAQTGTTPDQNTSNSPNSPGNPDQQILAAQSQSGRIRGTDLETDVIETHPTHSWRQVKVRRGDNLVRILNRQKISRADINAIINIKSKPLYQLKPGQIINLKISPDHQLLELATDLSLTDTFRVINEDNRFQATHDKIELETRVAYASGNIQHSLFLSGQKAGLSDALIMQLAEIFGWDIDFALDLREGDTFTVAYEEKYRRGEKVANGIIVAAKFNNGGKVYRSVAHRDNQSRLRYYTPEGENMRRAFLRTPVKFSRISSRFTRKRYHPVLKRWRAHKGVDYSAPTGTAIRTTAKGRIIFKGWKGGYGNTIIIKHGGSYSTLYAHMSRFARGMRVGKTVDQGRLIGRVGATGMVTGPHLHYEFRVRGSHRNPLTFKFPKAQSIPSQYRADFLQQARAWTEQLDVVGQRIRLAGNI